MKRIIQMKRRKKLLPVLPKSGICFIHGKQQATKQSKEGVIWCPKCGRAMKQN